MEERDSFKNVSSLNDLRATDGDMSDLGSDYSANQARNDDLKAQKEARNRKRTCIFVVLFFAMFTARSDQGIIPAVATTLKDYYGMDSVEIGSLGSMVYLGATAGSVIAIPFLDLVPTRIALLSCLVVQILSLYLFTWGLKWSHLAMARFLSGATQVILAIFLPVWVDAFAPSTKKTTWMTLVIAAAPMGLLAGYGMSALIVTYTDSWWFAFYTIQLALVPVVIVLAFIDNNDIDVKEHLKRRNEQNQNPNDALSVADTESLILQQSSVGGGATRYQLLLKRLMELEGEKTRDMDFKQRVWYILTRWDYVIYMFIMTCLFVVVTGLQFWITDYFVQVMHVNQSDAYQMYFMLGAIGPILGIALCAMVFDRLGGYTSHKAVPICGMFALGGMIFGLASTLVRENAIISATLIMFELFCGAFMMPAFTGIMLNQVPPNLRTIANSVANFSYNLFGYLPAPIMYGVFYEMGESKENRLGLISIQIFTVLAFSGFTIAYFRNRYVQRKYMHIEDFSLIQDSTRPLISDSQTEKLLSN